MAFLVPLVLASGTPVWADAKTDVIVLYNGDKITGEIERLERGTLQFKTDDLGTVSAEWDKVAQLSSRGVFEVELEKGKKYFGSLTSSAGDGMIGVVSLGREKILEMESVVRITPLGGSFRNAVEGFLDLGFEFAHANRSVDWTIGAEVSYRTIKHLSVIDGESLYSDQDDAEKTSRNEVGFRHDRFPWRRWIVSAHIGYEDNSVKDLISRQSAGLSFGRFIIQTNSTLFSLNAGISNAWESYEGTSGKEQNREASLTLDFSVAHLDDPEMDLSIEITGFTSISPGDRNRVELGSRWMYEIAKNLFFIIRLSDSYDSNPPQDNPEDSPEGSPEDSPADSPLKNDWDLGTSIGWSF
jgi:hypothetical protein